MIYACVFRPVIRRSTVSLGLRLSLQPPTRSSTSAPTSCFAVTPLGRPFCTDYDRQGAAVTRSIRLQKHDRFMRDGYIIDAQIAWWKLQTRKQATVLTVSGELDASNAGRFDRSVRELPRGGEPFVIDLSDVTFIGVPCFQTLLRLDAACRATGTRWALVINPPIHRIFAIAEYRDILPVTSSVPEALHSVNPAKGPALQVISSSRRRSKRLAH
jgi:anti-anti-sigma factor